LEYWHHDVTHVWRFGTIAQVDIHEGRRVARIPSWLYCNGTTSDRPLSSVCRRCQSATYESESVGKLFAQAKEKRLKRLSEANNTRAIDGLGTTHMDTSTACHTETTHSRSSYFLAILDTRVPCAQQPGTNWPRKRQATRERNDASCADCCTANVVVMDFPEGKTRVGGWAHNR
jgi:hypothetical protein